MSERTHFDTRWKRTRSRSTGASVPSSRHACRWVSTRWPSTPTAFGTRFSRAWWVSTLRQSITGESSTRPRTRSAVHERDTVCSEIAAPIDQPTRITSSAPFSAA